MIKLKVLLDTNIIIHREMRNPIEEDIGKLFWWFDKLGYKKYIHNVTSREILKMKNKDTLHSYSIKLESYNIFPTEAPINPEVQTISEKYDISIEDQV